MSDNEDNAGSEPEVDAEEAPKKGKGTKRKGKKDANKPKRPLSAYMFFCQAKRAETKAANPTMTFSELGKELGQMWQKLDESEKKPFIKQNERDKKRYEEEKEKYGPVDDEEDGGKKKKAKGGKKKDKDAPKNAKSAYMFFCNDERKRLKEEDPSISFGEIGKKMGENWKKLSDDKKQKYVDMATADKADKDAAKAEYNEKNPGKAKKTKKTKKAAEEDDDAADDAEGGDDDDAE